MEILIVGLIVVALMVYASTKIKRTVADAFEPETIETDEFIVKKPEGFLHVLNGDPKYLFEAYSKDFGEGDASGTRAARAWLRKYPANKKSEELPDLDEVLTDVSEVIGDHHYQLIEGVGHKGEIPLKIYLKTAARNGDRYAFKVESVAEANADLTGRIEALVASFEVK